jgi:lysyl-tRNA synthetase class 2
MRPVLELRHRVRRTIRDLFDGLGFLEVDTPVLAAEVLPEAHVDPLPVALAHAAEPRWLQASPENLMKRLLAAGSGPIYQFAPAFRDGERSPQHDVEFTILEWYAPGTTLEQAARLLERLSTAVLGTSGLARTTCSAAFLEHAGVDPLASDAGELVAAALRAGVALPQGIGSLPAAEAFDRAFESILADVVQPRLGHGPPLLLEAWPASQAAFARVDSVSGAARRFELFASGVELVNGWEEETAREPLAARIAAANEVRRANGRRVLPVPGRLLAAHGDAMPGSIGAALGFDRLVMLAAGARSIDEVRCFPDGG